MQEEQLPSDIMLGIEEFAIVKQLSYAKRICRDNKTAMKDILWIEANTSSVLKMPIIEVEPRLRAVLATGLVPIDVLQEVYKARMRLYELVLENQKEGIFG